MSLFDRIKEHTKSDIKVGKINSTDLFKEAEENSEELLSICKPGKLSEDKLIFSSNSGNKTSIELIKEHIVYIYSR